MPAPARRPALLIAGVLCLAALGLGTAAPAAAHTELVGSDPAADSTVAAARPR